MAFLDPRLDRQSQDCTIFSHFRQVIWRQLFPHDHRLDDSCGSDSHFMTLSMDFLEQEATRFPPVGIPLYILDGGDVCANRINSFPTL
jgi:hypothetical protein